MEIKIIPEGQCETPQWMIDAKNGIFGNAIESWVNRESKKEGC